MRLSSFDRDWLVGEQALGCKTVYTRVDLPHDFTIGRQRTPDSPGGASNAYYPGGCVRYEKTFALPAAWEGERLFLQFDGAYMNAEARVNGQLVGAHAYGYTGFRIEFTKYARFGRDNKVAVALNSPAPNTRWYAGCGLYRHVWLCRASGAYLTREGIFARAEVGPSGERTVLVEIEVFGEHDGKTLSVALFDHAGKAVAEAGGKASAKTVIEMKAGKGARLWSPDDPYLYELRVRLDGGKEIIEEERVKIGFRTVRVDARSGLTVNGKQVKMRGGCVHHDNGILGAASYDRAEERKVELLKASGFNAIRCAHNPPAPAMLDACDRLGVLVIDEAFDCWREGKNPNDYHVVFERDWREDISAMVKRDRNHPSVIMWSTGNEVVERDGRSEGAKWSKALADAVRELDPTRPVTNALCGLWDFPDLETAPDDPQSLWAQRTENFVKPLDVVGYNYLLDRYERDAKRYPNRVVCSTESFPMQALDNVEAVERWPHLIGDFVWTGLDYLGEAGIGRAVCGGSEDSLGQYPWHAAWCGDIDICGFKRPQSYYRDVLYGIARRPMTFCFNPANDPGARLTQWGWPDVYRRWDWPGYAGRAARVVVYSAAPEIELRLNGHIIGRKKCGRDSRYIAEFNLPYTPGRLEAVAFDGAKELSRDSLVTAERPVTLRVTPDRRKIKSAFGDLCYLVIEAADEDGNTVHGADFQVTVSVHGAGEFVAAGNSDPKTEEVFTSPTRRLCGGRMLAVVRSVGRTGEMSVTCVAAGLPPATITIEAVV